MAETHTRRLEEHLLRLAGHHRATDEHHARGVAERQSPEAAAEAARKAQEAHRGQG